MRTIPLVGAAAVLCVGTVLAAPSPQKARIGITRQQLVALHASIISRAAPPVRLRINASAEALKQYVARCGHGCDVDSFLRGDLKRRFTRLTDPELRLLVGLTLGQAFVTESEAAALRLEELIREKDQLVGMLTDLLNEKNSTESSVVNNIKP